MSTTTCPLCGVRKAKRHCPALDRQICAVCCGTKRLIEIRCPATCAYLSSARSHPPAVVQRRQERDVRFLLPLLSDLTEAQYALVVFFQNITLEHAKSAVPPLLDAEVSAAATAFAATMETAGKGIIYQHQASSLPAQRLSSRIEAAFAELLKRAGSRSAALERDAAVALRRLARLADEAQRGLPDDEAPVFLRLAARLAAAGAGQPESESAGTSRDDRPSGLIIPG